MKKLILNLFLALGLLITLPCQADTENDIQAIAIEKLLSVRNVDVSSIDNICNPNICLNESSHDSSGISAQLVSGKVRDDFSILLRAKKLSQKTQKAETYAVFVTVLEGYTFHVADYYGSWGNSRVVTALDGQMRGRQEIADNGVVMAASTDVKWHNDYFEHTYPAGKIYTYKDKQVLKLKLK